MVYDLTDEYLAEARQRAYRYQGQWTGTAGALAADVARLLIERKTMQGTITDLKDTNSQLRAAVEDRLAGKASMPTPDQLFGAGCCDVCKRHTTPEELEAGWREITQASAAKYAADRLAEDSLLEDQGDIRPGSREFLDVLDELKQLHLRKTMDYGVDEDALSNIRSSADVVNMPAWAGCILRISDKMHRLKAFFLRGRCEFDGVEDTLKDIACYAAIALVLHREQQESLDG
jgi:hypothetical protein